MGYTKDAFKGLSWMSGFRVVTRVVAFVRIGILARLLTPDQFGIFGIASLVLAFFDTFSQTGTNIILFQERKRYKKYLDSAFLISIVRGIVGFGLLYVFSTIVGKYFNSYESVKLIRLIGIVSIIRGFINPLRIIFLKSLRYDREFWFSFAVFMVDSLVSVLSVYILSSPIGLIYGLIAGALLEAVMSYVLINEWPHIKFNLQQIRSMLSRGKWVTGTTVFIYLFEQGDDMFVGKLLGTRALGIYQAAYKISTMPITEVTKVFNQVTLPIYSNIALTKKRLRSAFHKITLTIIILTIPLGIIFYLFSYQITLLILGQNWLEVSPIVKSLALFGVVRAITFSINPLLHAIKKQEAVAKLSFVSFLGLFITIIPFINKFALVGAPYSALAGSLFTLPFAYYYYRKYLY